VPTSVVEGLFEAGHALGEGTAVATDAELTNKLNSIYGSDVSSAQRFMLAVRFTTAISGAAGTAKAANTAGESVAKVAARKLDEIKAEKEAAQALAKQRIENNATVDMSGYGKAAVRDFVPGTTHRAENINAGQVTDRDGLPRIDEAKKFNDAQVAQNLNQNNASYYGTARPAWMEGSFATDTVLTKPEIYRMVVNESEYKTIENALLVKKDPVTAAQQLGGWATKDPVTSAADVRGKLAISSEWKGRYGEPMYVVEFTAKPGVGVREGTVGTMFDNEIKATLPGGGHQVQFLEKSPRTNPELYQINLTNAMELK
jgi:hypothetical protein